MSTKRKTRTPRATLIGWRDGDARLTALEDQLRELVEARAKHNENMLRWRKTTNDLIDTLDRGLRKLEEKNEANAEHQDLAARIDGLKADFERFRSDARERLARVEGDKEEPIEPDPMFAEQLRAPSSDRAMSEDESLRQRIIELDAKALLRFINLVMQISQIVARP